VKVLDFGLVRSTWADETGVARLTRDGVASGTPAYMPPEVALVGREIDARADLYALGCVAYWLVTGQRVFEAENAMQMALQHVQTPPVPPSRRTELPVPPSLERVIPSCLEKDPEKRPPTAEELALRLAACELDNPWTPEQARRWWQTHLPPRVENKV
jgi:serine/threonine-protein kinase